MSQWIQPTGGQLFLNPLNSSTDEDGIMKLWNVDPSTESSQTEQAIEELSRNPDTIARDVVDVVLKPDSSGFYSSQTQRDLLFSLDHDSLTRSNFNEAALHAIDFALADPNSQVTASDKSELQDEKAEFTQFAPTLPDPVLSPKDS